MNYDDIKQAIAKTLTELNAKNTLGDSERFTDVDSVKRRDTLEQVVFGTPTWQYTVETTTPNTFHDFYF